MLAVPPGNEARVRADLRRAGVEMTVIGHFTGDGRLHLRYGDQVVADISMAFLHDGIPRRVLQGTWQRPMFPEPAASAALGRCAGRGAPGPPGPPERAQQGGRGAPLRPRGAGRHAGQAVRGRREPGSLRRDRAAAAGGHQGEAVAHQMARRGRAWPLGCGINPAYGAIDPYAMAISAIDEAVRNVVAVGADPDRIAILDNFLLGQSAPARPHGRPGARLQGLLRRGAALRDALYLGQGQPEQRVHRYGDETTGIDPPFAADLGAGHRARRATVPAPWT